MSYAQFKRKNDKDFNDFMSKNCFWAFSEKQLDEGLALHKRR